MLCRIGEIEVWRILEWQGLFLPPEELFPNAPPDVAQIMEDLAPGTVDAGSGRIILPVQAYLLKTPDQVVLVDTGIGNHKTSKSLPFWSDLTDTRFLSALATAGVTPEDVDYVLFTHLHIDHVGWNTSLREGAWVPTFPKARYLMPKDDVEMLSGRGLAVYDESLAPVIEAGLMDQIDAAYQHDEQISLLPTPGHTPGHVSVLLSSGGQDAVLTGDALHSTAQCQNPHWQFKFDADPDLAVASRRTLLEICVERGLTVIGSHFTLPSIGQVTSDGHVFRWTER
ncbi:MAG: MBL fold metallo-hydrolase [Pseudomonadota bacterium]